MGVVGGTKEGGTVGKVGGAEEGGTVGVVGGAEERYVYIVQ